MEDTTFRNPQHHAGGNYKYRSTVRPEDHVIHDMALHSVKLESNNHKICDFYKCKMCRYRTTSSLVMQSHLKRHKITRPAKPFNCLRAHLEEYKCNMCEYRTPYLIYFTKHVSMGHHQEQVNFEKGGTTVKQPKTVKNLNRRNQSRTYYCKYCSFTTFSQLFCVSHCEMCPVKLFLKENNKKRLKVQKKSKRLKSQKKYKLKRLVVTLLNRIAVQKKETEGQIEVESLAKIPAKLKHQSRRVTKVPIKNYLNRRHIEDSGIAWFNCNQCSYKSVSSGHLKKHIQAQHNAAINSTMSSFPSTTCLALQGHLLENHASSVEETKPEKKFQCTSCDFKSTDPEGLKDHILINHVSTKTIVYFQCEMCLYENICQQLLTKHVLEHMDSEQLDWVQCAICLGKLKTREALKKHIFDKHIL